MASCLLNSVNHDFILDLVRRRLEVNRASTSTQNVGGK
jgi:hypothetical protein